MKRRNDTGLNSLDLLTVLLVVGALASVTVPAFLSSSQRVQAAVCASNRAAIVARAASFQRLKGVYPTTMAELIDKSYFAAIPQCPGHGVYVFNPAGTGATGAVYCSIHYAGLDAGESSKAVAAAPAAAAAP